MHLHRFSLQQLPAKPWKNGAGSTKELTCFPADADINDFVWRISVAELKQAADYSIFAGVNRTQILIQGNGVNLRGDSGESFNLPPLQAFHFAGEQLWHCEPDGVCQMLNIMTLRDAVRSELALVHGDFSCVGDGQDLVLVIVQGEYKAEPHEQSFSLGDVIQPVLALGEVLSLSASFDAVLIAVKLLNKSWGHDAT